MQEFRYTLRLLLRDPGFTAVTVSTLALGIGATTAIYSVVNTVLLNPIPGPEPERLVQIAERNYTRGNFSDQNNKPFFVGLSPPVLEALLANQQLFTGLTWADGGQLARKTEDFIEELYGYRVPPNFFRFLNVSPLLGRTFAEDEATPVGTDGIPTKDSVIVISHGWWQSHFGGD